LQLLPADLWKEMMRFVAHDSIYEFASGFAIRMRLIEYFKQDIDVKIHAKKMLDEYYAHHCMTREKKSDLGFVYFAWGPPYL
jgi:hypothetical protein